MDIFTKLRSFTFVIYLFIYIERDIAYCEVTTPRQRNREVGDPTEKGTLRRTTALSGGSLFLRSREHPPRRRAEASHGRHVTKGRSPTSQGGREKDMWWIYVRYLLSPTQQGPRLALRVDHPTKSFS
uniref:Uncharacterized protein n=1 Tax=Ixodes ricinus TaxID=34613 RepID=A0A6B0UQU4_IXORI